MMKHLVVAMAVGGVLALGAGASVHAAAFTDPFLRVVSAAECTTDGLAEATLTFDEIAGGDLNDYTATLFFEVAASAAHAFIDQVQFKIDGASYEGLPSLTTAPAGGTWTPFFGKRTQLRQWRRFELGVRRPRRYRRGPRQRCDPDVGLRL